MGVSCHHPVFNSEVHLQSISIFDCRLFHAPNLVMTLLTHIVAYYTKDSHPNSGELRIVNSTQAIIISMGESQHTAIL